MQQHNTRNTEAVIVIGAGASGLAAARALDERRIPVRILERSTRPGDAWYHRHPQLRLNTHRQLSSLPGLAIPKSAGAYPSRDSIIGYLDDYAAGLDVPIDYGVEVTRIEARDDAWIIETDKRVYRARHVVVATGLERIPHIPDWPGRDNYPGVLRHAADFGEIDDYRGKDILVIGAGNSGSDILNNLSAIDTGRVWASVRHGPVVFPKRLYGIPVQRLSPVFAVLPLRVADALLSLTEYIAFGRLSRWGLRKHPDGGATRLVESGVSPAIDDGFVAALKAGRITVVPEVERFESAGLRLVDGRYLEPDFVIAATGYRTGMEAILGHTGLLDELGVPLIHGAEQKDECRGIWFTGMRPRLTGFFHLAGKTAAEITDAIEAELRLDAAYPAGSASGRLATVHTESCP
ncbi:MAG: NAD(P)/FAD-dependent oxidoreductase [Gammaproteobacteria bacterium]|jgi:cation diffusion facilitator CzcD-associated flavoprotein CzcO